MPSAWPAIVTLAALFFYAVMIANVGRARDRYGIKAPSVVGHPDFERVHRVQQNTLEQLALFLPALWLCAIFLSPVAASAVGVLWILGRIVYAIGYTRAASKRGLGFLITFLAFSALWLGACWGVLKTLLTAEP
jgi:glutathione S-transferase